MPRSLQDVLNHVDELATRFEDHDADPASVADAAALRAVRAVRNPAISDTGSG